MKTTSIRARALSCALLAGTALCAFTAAPAAAQTSPTFRHLDSNGVDLVKGDFLTSFPEGSIGSGEAELALLRLVGAVGGGNATGSQWDNVLLTIDSSGTSVDFGSRHDKFPGAESRGAILSGSGGSYQYRAPDGTVIAFTDPTTHSGDVNNFCGSSGTRPSCILLPTTITAPDGKTITLDYEFWSTCTPGGVGMPDGCTHTPRLLHVSNSYGYRVSFFYAAQNQGGTSPPADFHKRAEANFYNLLAGSPGTSRGRVVYTYPADGVVLVKDMGGRTWRVTASDSGYAVRRPGAASDTLSVTTSNGIVASVVDGGVTTQYSRSVWGNNPTQDSHVTMTVTRVVPGGTGPVSTIVSDLALGRPVSAKDPLNRTTAYQYDSAGRLKRVTQPEGNYVEHGYDSRGNVTHSVAVPKGGVGPTIVASASFPATCDNPVTCNRPDSTTDARGNTTDYTYDPVHGGVLTVAAPAPAPGAVRPQTHFSYSLVNGEHKLTGTSQCQAGSACAGTADEVKSTLAYDPNGNLISTSSGNGSGTLTATSTMAYDLLGNLTAVDGPLPGAADTRRIRYNAARQVEGTISPDPDGTGPLLPRAVRNTYSNGLLTKVEQGNVPGHSNLDWLAFSPAEAVETVYDAHARPEKVKLVSGSIVYALTQTSYDALGRPECTALRMNRAGYGSLPASACAPGSEGGDGPDRVTRTLYDAAGRVVRIRTALGTPDEADEVATAYTANGLVQTVTDAENNRTTYEYDGHDRLSKTFYPMPSPKGAATSNANDFEQRTYESLAGGARTSGLVVASRNRAGETIGFVHDGLGRLILKDRPGGEPDLSFGYDLLGRMTSASQAGSAFAFAWDPLGRQLSETGPRGTVASEFDLAGRRIRIVYPDGFFVDQDHLVTGEIRSIRENGAVSGIGVLATFGYDDLGRRTSLTRGNGTVTSYAYDAVSRLEALSQDLAGTAHDLALGFAYDPASQIVAHTRSNDAYSWTGHGSGSIASSANGLNQIVSHGGTATAHDPKGNLAFDPTVGKGYGYSSENLLVSVALSATVTGTLAYDPLMRLAEAGVSAKTKVLHDGGQRIAEYNGGGTAMARFVNGPGADEPLVEYQGAGLATRRWLHADQLGSIVARSDDGGNLVNINTYDEQGRLGSTNAGRFHFAGQPYETLSDLYYSRARMRNPRLGRFMQPDPIGYAGGINLYAYAAGDPVNLVDPSGHAPKKPKATCTGSRISSACGAGGGIAYGLSGSTTAGVGGQAAGHFETVRAGGAAVDLGDGGFEITSTKIWVSDVTNVSFDFAPASTVDRCAARATPPNSGQSFSINPGQFASKAAEKYNQHSWPLNARGDRQSVFGGQITSPAELATRALILVSTHDAVPAGGLNVRVTGDVGVQTGRDIRSPLPSTTYLTVVLGPPDGVLNGLPLRPAVSMYPGC